jgi:hypothetical protein
MRHVATLVTASAEGYSPELQSSDIPASKSLEGVPEPFCGKDLFQALVYRRVRLSYSYRSFCVNMDTLSFPPQNHCIQMSILKILVQVLVLVGSLSAPISASYQFLVSRILPSIC